MNKHTEKFNMVDKGQDPFKQALKKDVNGLDSFTMEEGEIRTSNLSNSKNVVNSNIQRTNTTKQF